MRFISLDTAHGLLVWAVGAVIGVALLASAATSLVGGSAQVAAAGGGALAERGDTGSSYFVDTLFRSTKPETADARPLPTAEVEREFWPSACATAECRRTTKPIWRS